MNANDRKPNVHLVKIKDDGTRVYGIGVWSDRSANYTAPLDRQARELTGCFAEFSRYPIGRMTLHKARYEARKVFGYSKLHTGKWHV